MPCKLCGADKRLVDAHIIPRGMWKHMRDGEKAPFIVSNVAGTYPRRSRTGEYDQNLVCADCERIFGPWDDYAIATLFAHPRRENVVTDGGDPLAYVFGLVDYPKLTLFFLSLLWRAGASERDVFKKVQLGPHQAWLAEMLRRGDPGDAETYAVVVTRFTDTGMVMDPFRERIDGITYYRMYLPWYTLWIKVDRRPTPPVVAHAVLRPDAPLVAILRDFRNSKEWPVAAKLVKQQHEWLWKH